jgi:hypothetical protein
MKRHIIIGDIHGCIDELKALIVKLDLNNNDELFFIGDLIDKGPDSVGVVKYVYELSKRNKIVLILGNHEEKFLRYLYNKDYNSNALADMIIAPDFEMLANELSSYEIEYLKASYYSYVIPENNLILIHGGFTGDCKLNFNMNYQYNVHSPKEYKGLDLITKTRYIDAKGNFVGLGLELEDNPFWAEAYLGNFGKAIFGHQPFMQDNPKLFPHAIGIDNGCVFGGYLSAIVFEGNNQLFVSVAANKKYSALKY